MANNCVSCGNCGATGWSKPKGSILITLLLALFFIIPAIIYEIWRRIGLGVCGNCGSDSIKPSTLCTTQREIDLMSLVVLFAIGIAGAVVLLFAYAFINGVISGDFSKKSSDSRQRLQEVCMTDGLRYYQNIGSYPNLPNGEETLSYVMNVCKTSKDGNFKKP